jgi:hypothetical protein
MPIPSHLKVNGLNNKWMESTKINKTPRRRNNKLMTGKWYNGKKMQKER